MNQCELNAFLNRRNPTDEEVAAAIRSVPTHYSAHRLMQDLSILPWTKPDPAAGNTTAGSGLLTDAPTFIMEIQLQQTAAAPEIRTLNDPLKSFHTLALVLTSYNSQNLVVRCSTPLWLGSSVTQPAITQNGQYLTFSALNQVAILRSVPAAKQSYSGTQTTFTNMTGVRWMVMQLDGVTLT